MIVTHHASAPELLEALELAMTMLNDIYSPMNQKNSPTFKFIHEVLAQARREQGKGE